MCSINDGNKNVIKIAIMMGETRIGISFLLLTMCTKITFCYNFYMSCECIYYSYFYAVMFF